MECNDYWIYTKWVCWKGIRSLQENTFGRCKFEIFVIFLTYFIEIVWINGLITIRLHALSVDVLLFHRLKWEKRMPWDLDAFESNMVYMN